MQDDLYYMNEAINEAKKALQYDEVPIGALVVDEFGEIIGRGFNTRETSQKTSAHAEMTAILMANESTGFWRLEGCTLYVTLEPCPMCAGAIIQSRIKRVVYGAVDEKAGCCGTIYNLLNEERFNHQTEITAGILEEECALLLKDFFKALRLKKKQQKLDVKPNDVLQ